MDGICGVIYVCVCEFVTLYARAREQTSLSLSRPSSPKPRLFVHQGGKDLSSRYVEGAPIAHRPRATRHTVDNQR